MERGADPSTGLAATIPGFVFPLVPSGTPISYRDDFAEPGGTDCYGHNARCAITLTAQPATVVVAAASGVLAAATPEEQSRGIAFWIVSGADERIGYSGLAAYAPGIADRVVVNAGQALGSGTRETLVAWERSGQRINPFPLLQATFPSQG